MTNFESTQAFSVRYLGPIDAKGTRYRVQWTRDGRKVQATVSADFSAHDAFTAALETVTGIDADRFEQTNDSPTNRWYTLKPAHRATHEPEWKRV